MRDESTVRRSSCIEEALWHSEVKSGVGYTRKPRCLIDSVLAVGDRAAF
jgi:hypothetical protein